MAVSQASQAPGPGPNGPPPVGGTRPVSILIRPSAGLIQTTTSPREMMFLPCEIWGGGSGLALPVSPHHLYVFCILCSSRAWTEILFCFGFFWVNICDALITVAFFFSHFTSWKVTCQSRSTGRSVSRRQRRRSLCCAPGACRYSFPLH